MKPDEKKKLSKASQKIQAALKLLIQAKELDDLDMDQDGVFFVFYQKKSESEKNDTKTYTISSGILGNTSRLIRALSDSMQYSDSLARLIQDTMTRNFISFLMK